MILVNENKLKCSLFGNNTDKILIDILAYNISTEENEGETIKKIIPKYLAYNYELYKAGDTHSERVDILNKVSNILVPDNYDLNTISVEKLIAQSFETELKLTGGTDFNIISEIEWKHEDMAARVTIPANLIVKTPELRLLAEHVEGLIDKGEAYKYEDDYKFVFYFKQILSEHLAILNMVEHSILIEE